MSSALSSLPISLPLKPDDWSPLLDSDERYEVYAVKAAERPQLLSWTLDDDQDDDNKDPPLLDGCDISGWRRERLVPVSTELQGILNVGAGCFLRRRDSQCWTVVSKSAVWETLRGRLLQTHGNNISHVDCEEMSALIEWKFRFRTTRFACEWERRNEPVLVENCTNGWKAMPAYGDCGASSSCGGWTFQQLLARFPTISWRFSDTHGQMMPLSTYAKYLSNPEGLTDDSPLAIYDSLFGDDEPTRALLDEYQVPPCFSPDLFDLAACDPQNRPPYRWILIGPSRSGTGLHVDPLWTNAWVTVLQGRKRWLLFPPNTPPTEIGMDGPHQIPSVVWFRDFYDKVTSLSWPKEWRPIECLQSPGQTVFVPNGWPHLVLNLELTVAVTHNYASEFGPFERMWKKVATEESEFASKWYEGLVQHRPDLAALCT